MTREELDNYLESIGGLENGIFTNREPIKSSYIFEVGQGWFQLIHDLIEELIEDGWNKQICQVKEKYGTLRFYTNSVNHDIIKKYMELSSVTCEMCGEKGIKRGFNWIVTLCDSCTSKTEIN